MTETRECSECGKPAVEDEIFKYDKHFVCASCKLVFIQKLKEGASDFYNSDNSRDMEYAGFWVRLEAKVIDGLIIGMFLWLMATVLREPFFSTGSGLESEYWTFIKLMGAVVALTFDTLFIGKLAATPGKMALKLTVVTADGKRVTYLKAFVRVIVEKMGRFTLMAGHIMAAFDTEKRALHDIICSTRVIRQ